MCMLTSATDCTSSTRPPIGELITPFCLQRYLFLHLTNKMDTENNPQQSLASELASNGSQALPLFYAHLVGPPHTPTHSVPLSPSAASQSDSSPEITYRMPSTAPPKIRLGGRRGPQKAHIPYRNNSKVGTKTGIAIQYVERKSDGFEPFEEIMQQADKCTPPKLDVNPREGKASNPERVL